LNTFWCKRGGDELIRKGRSGRLKAVRVLEIWDLGFFGRPFGFSKSGKKMFSGHGKETRVLRVRIRTLVVTFAEAEALI